MMLIRDAESPHLICWMQDPAPPPVQDRGAAPTTTERTETPDGPREEQPQQSCSDAMLGNLPLLLGFAAIFYFLIIRPGQKQEKARREMLGALKKGDKVVTGSGMHGTVAAIDDQTVSLRVTPELTLKFDRSAISRVIRDEAAPAPTTGGPTS